MSEQSFTLRSKCRRCWLYLFLPSPSEVKETQKLEASPAIRAGKDPRVPERQETLSKRCSGSYRERAPEQKAPRTSASITTHKFSQDYKVKLIENLLPTQQAPSARKMF